jgi:hypothetical protein
VVLLGVHFATLHGSEPNQQQQQQQQQLPDQQQQ